MDVQDYGPGIAPDDQQRIFDRFYQAAGGSGASTSGLGLGLFISRQIVAAHGGTIEVHSVPGEGATFTVRLPLA